MKKPKNMTPQEATRIKACEELGELVQAIMKLAMFPEREVHPDGKDSFLRIQEEVADVLACIQVLAYTHQLDWSAIGKRKNKKLIKFHERYELDVDSPIYPRKTSKITLFNLIYNRVIRNKFYYAISRQIKKLPFFSRKEG